MIMTGTLLACAYGVTVLVFAALATYVWRYRQAPGALYFTMIMACGTLWSLGCMLQMLTDNMQQAILFAKLTYIGIVPIPVLWMFFNVSYSQRSRLVGGKWQALWIVPACILALVFTNEWHGLFWTDITPVAGGSGNLLVYDYGVGMLAHMIYSYALMIGGTVLLVVTSVRTYRQYSGQTVTLLLGALVPYAGNVVYFVWVNRYLAFDPTPMTLAIMGLIYAWSIYRYRLLDLVPVARDTIFANMSEAVVVIDDKDRIIDLNPAARQLLTGQAPPGKPVTAAFADWPELLARLPELGEQPVEVLRSGGEGTRFFDAHVSPLVDDNGMQTGRSLVLRDITRRKLNECALDESRRNLRTLFDTVDDLIFVVDQEGRVMEVNKALVRRLDYKKGDVVGSDLRNLDGGEQGGSPGQATRGSARPSSLTTRSGDVIKVETRLARGLWGGRPAVFGVSRDITRLAGQQAELTHANLALLDEIEERRAAEAKIEVSLREKDLLLKEIHHRVKNNLQIITSLLNLQKAYEHDAGVVAAIVESQNRIMSMALVHEKLYGSQDLSRIDLRDYVQSLTAYLTRAYATGPHVRVEVRIGDVAMGADEAVPCGLLITELVSNSLKYAFQGRASGTVKVSYERSGGVCRLSVGDDGVGLPPGLDTENPATRGLQLVNSLVRQAGGSLELDRAAGTRFTITFPDPGRPETL